MKNFTKKSGFTLIELLVAISIIGILTAVGVNTFENSQGRARDSKRQEDLKSIEKALELYYQDNKAYPTTGLARWSTCTGAPYVTQTTNGWIPGLVTGNYIRQLPLDPKRGTSTAAMANTYSNGAGTSVFCYVYLSNGTDYKMYAHCAIEGKGIDTNNVFYHGGALNYNCDNGGLSYTYAIYSDGGVGF
ncbi:MAG TPA: prepilin-type N-terminal cleavage/methylation domain-containing protein [Candidatus Saccharimonadales bacterium]|nr:prepilin-type N-terminal cleavage/methylation domain-containing protein [Candidatus Saccharimonadales bacterium]